MGLFSKLKEKKRLKEIRKKQWSFVYGDGGPKWLEGLFHDLSVYCCDDMFGEADPTGWNDEQICEQFRSWDFYKKVKSFAKPDGKKGEEYRLCYEELWKEGKQPDGSEWDTKFNFRGDYLDVLQYFDAALVADDDFWYEEGEAKTTSAPFPRICELTGWDYWNILAVAVWLDRDAVFNGTSPYVRFARAVLKSYEMYGKNNPSLWNKTMERLTYWNHEEKGHFYRHGGFLAARFGQDDRGHYILDRCLPPRDSDGSCGYNALAGYANLVEVKARQCILFNEEFWTSNDDAVREQAFATIDDFSERAFRSYLNCGSSKGKKEEENEDGLTAVEIE